jgi:hypothetical protein
MFYQKF